MALIYNIHSKPLQEHVVITKEFALFTEEAENERMHLLTALQLRKPSWFFRLAVVCSQGTLRE